MQSFMDGLIDPKRWTEWSEDFALGTMYYLCFKFLLHILFVAFLDVMNLLYLFILINIYLKILNIICLLIMI